LRPEVNGELSGDQLGRIRTGDRVEENKMRGYCVWQEWALGVLALDGKLRDNPC